MTPRVLTTTVFVTAAFALVIPAAWGSEPVRDNGDATQAKLEAQPSPLVIVRDHGDATAAQLVFQSAPVVARETAMKAALRAPSPGIVRDHGDATAAKLALQSAQETLPAAPTSTTGRDLEWSQLGIGFGLGMFLVVGVILAFRFTRSRTLAH